MGSFASTFMYYELHWLYIPGEMSELREAVDGYASACAHNLLLLILPGEGKPCGEFCSGRGGVCGASGVGVKQNIHWEGLPDEGVLWGRLSLYKHTKLDSSRFSRFRDTKVITHRITDRQNHRHHNRINIASFAYIRGRRHKH